MISVVSVDSMRISDAKTQTGGTSGRELMFRAGKAIYDSFEKKGKTAVLCGSGNNAGDGFVVAYLLAEKGYECKIFLCSDRFSADGGYISSVARKRVFRTFFVTEKRIFPLTR